jgi:alkanesulfonate monooxygenase SsuD/methylene tetrahydromethanopterin reductase-like flavin-dependent oxidoreductase (luciferase family)
VGRVVRPDSLGARRHLGLVDGTGWNDEGREVWRRAEALGFHAAYTYDHLSWRVPFRDRTWFGAVPTLTAAAGVTDRMRLGTLVTSVKPRSRITG